VDHQRLRPRYVSLSYPTSLLRLADLVVSYSVSRQASEAFEAVALHNSSEGGGDLPKHFRFARLNYNTETILTTRWWMWK
jgi:hypothetical protein